MEKDERGVRRGAGQTSTPVIFEASDAFPMGREPQMQSMDVSNKRPSQHGRGISCMGANRSARQAVASPRIDSQMLLRYEHVSYRGV